MNQDQIIREVENKILDREFLKFPALFYSEDILVLYLLRTFGDTLRIAMYSDRTGQSIGQFLNVRMKGLSQCCKWAHNTSGFINQFDEDLIRMQVVDFLDWGADYVTVSQHFVAWSRGVNKVILDEPQKKITFSTNDEADAHSFINQALSSFERLNTQFSSFDIDDLYDFYDVWSKEIRLEKKPLIFQIDLERVKNTEVLDKICSISEKYVFPELDHNLDVGGYTIHQFVKFYSALFIVYKFVMNYHISLDMKVGFSNSIGSYPMITRKSDIIRKLANTTDLSDLVIENILNDLTLNTNNFHSALTSQPFILTKTGSYFLLPEIFASIDPQRMISGALISKRGGIYANLINTIENVYLKKYAETLSKIDGLIVHKEKKIKTGKSYITPDIIIRIPESKRLLICDFKNFVPPVTAGEVANRIKETDKGFDQVKRYKSIIRNDTCLIELNCDVDYAIELYLLIRYPMPIPLNQNDEITMIDTTSFLEILKDKVHNSIEPKTNFPLFTKYDFEPQDIKKLYRDIKAGEWIFSLEYLAVK